MRSRIGPTPTICGRSANAATARPSERQDRRGGGMTLRVAGRPVGEDADALALELDDVAGRQEAPRLHAGAARHGARAEHLAGVQRARLRRVRDERAPAVVHLRAAGARALLAVDAQDELEVAAVDLVGGRQAGAEHVGAVPVLGLAGAHAERQLAGLGVARGEVVPQRPAEDVVERVRGARCRCPARPMTQASSSS